MANTDWGNVYKKLGARPVINATGNQTVRGGSTPSPAVREAMLEADTSYVEMEELLEKSGHFIAERLGVEDAYVTAGCYAALVLAAATVMTGSDADKRAQLPDTTGLRDEIVFQKVQHYTYDRAFTIPGSKLIFVIESAAAYAYPQQHYLITNPLMETLDWDHQAILTTLRRIPQPDGYGFGAGFQIYSDGQWQWTDEAVNLTFDSWRWNGDTGLRPRMPATCAAKRSPTCFPTGGSNGFIS